YVPLPRDAAGDDGAAVGAGDGREGGDGAEGRGGVEGGGRGPVVEGPAGRGAVAQPEPQLRAREGQLSRPLGVHGGVSGRREGDLPAGERARGGLHVRRSGEGPEGAGLDPVRAPGASGG